MTTEQSFVRPSVCVEGHVSRLYTHVIRRIWVGRLIDCTLLAPISSANDYWQPASYFYEFLTDTWALSVCTLYCICRFRQTKIGVSYWLEIRTPCASFHVVLFWSRQPPVRGAVRQMGKVMPLVMRSQRTSVGVCMTSEVRLLTLSWVPQIRWVVFLVICFVRSLLNARMAQICTPFFLIVLCWPFWLLVSPKMLETCKLCILINSISW